MREYSSDSSSRVDGISKPASCPSFSLSLLSFDQRPTNNQMCVRRRIKKCSENNFKGKRAPIQPQQKKERKLNCCPIRACLCPSFFLCPRKGISASMGGWGKDGASKEAQGWLRIQWDTAASYEAIATATIIDCARNATYCNRHLLGPETME